MRHILLSSPVATLPFGVGVAATQTGLVAAAGGTHGTSASLVGTLRRAVAVTTITVAANEHCRAATSA
jgi:hypothetical protein